LRISDPTLRSLIQGLSDFERRALRRFLSGIADDFGRITFFKIKSRLKAKARSGKARR